MNFAEGTFEMQKSLELLLSLQKAQFFKVYFTPSALKNALFKMNTQRKNSFSYIQAVLRTAGENFL